MPYGTWELCRSPRAKPPQLPYRRIRAIYPPSFLRHLKQQGTAFESLCPANDDVWITVNALRAAFPIAQVRETSVHFPPIPGSQRERLSNSNVAGGGTQRELSATLSAADVDRLRTLARRAIG